MDIPTKIYNLAGRVEAISNLINNNAALSVEARAIVRELHDACYEIEQAELNNQQALQPPYTHENRLSIY